MAKSLSEEQNKVKIKPVDDHPAKPDNQKKPNIPGQFTDVELIGELNGELDEIISSRAEWEQRNVRWYRQRYGVRPKRNFPWPGASNISIPTIDKAIKKLVPAFMNLIFGPEKTCKFEVSANTASTENVYEEAEYNEILLDDLIRNRMDNSFDKMLHTVDKMLERGHCIMKVAYEYRTRTKDVVIDLQKDLNKEQKTMLINNLDELMTNDRPLVELFVTLLEAKGVIINLSDPDEMKEVLRNVLVFRDAEIVVEAKFTFRIDIPEAHSPYWQTVNPEDFIIAGDSNDIQGASMVGHVMRFSENELRNMARRGLVDKDVAQAILEKNSARPEQNTKRDERQNTTSLKATQEQYQGSYWYSYGRGNDPIELREVFFTSVDKDGAPRKYVMLYSPLYQEKALKFHELDYDHGKWPFVKFQNEYTNDGWLASRGIPQILDYLATTRDTMHNQKIDRMTIFNAPMMKYVTGMVNPANVRYIPGQFIPTKDINAVQPMVFPNNSQSSYIEEERELKGEIEDYLPFVDFSITDPQAGTSKSRTLGEVMAAKQDKIDRFSLDAKVFMESYNDLLEMTWAMWMQYGEAETDILVAGSDQPVTWKKQYGVNQMQIRPRGTLYNSNPALKLQQAQEDLALIDHPVFSKFVEPYVLLREYFKAKDVDSVNLKLKPLQQVIQEQQAEQEMMQQQQQQSMQMQQAQIQQEQKFELDKIRLQNAGKMEVSENQGRARVGMEALKIKSNNGNGKAAK